MNHQKVAITGGAGRLGRALVAEMRGRADVTVIARVPMDDGKPTGAYVDFMTGFMVDNDHVWGRPAGVTVTRDGALLVSDDANGTIYYDLTTKTGDEAEIDGTLFQTLAAEGSSGTGLIQAFVRTQATGSCSLPAAAGESGVMPSSTTPRARTVLSGIG